jgi:hypothetical protein
MRSVWILALAACGCRGILGIDGPPARGTADASSVDAPTDGATIDCTTWHPDGLDPCALPITVDSFHIAAPGYQFDTSGTGTLYDGAHAPVPSVLHAGKVVMQTGGSPILVLSVGQATIDAGADLAVTGPMPLVVLSWTSTTIAGALDAGSHLGVTDANKHTAETIRFGAGANQGCTASAGKNGNTAATGGSGGGGGGGFQGAGGLGGHGGPDTVLGGIGGQSGSATVVRAGCPGGTSGPAGMIATKPASAGVRAQGGAGGGAIRLVARSSISLAASASISAGGAGGAGAPTSSACGGGGGGGGGYLGFEAPVVELGGSIAANGGGGGGGASTSETGDDGSDGALGTQPAPGGDAATTCGSGGGSGAAAATLTGGTAGNTDACSGGGGGGGGAAGAIVIVSPAYSPGGATLSPAPQVR